MHLAFDICQGIGIAAAAGIRPFLPGLAAGALAAGDVEIHFDHTSYVFLQSSWFLLVLAVGAVALVMVERSALGSRIRNPPFAYLLIAISCGIGGAFLAGSLCRGGTSVIWPGWVGGVICAAIGVAGSRPLIERTRRRLDAGAAAIGLPLIAEGSALLIAVVSVLAPPLGPVAALLLLWLAIRGRGRGEEKYAGLRILR